jgi:hypothetical protein
VFSIKTLAMATALSAGVVFAMPAIGQAMPQSAPVKVDGAKNSNIVEVRHKNRSKRFARYCRRNWDDPRCDRSHRHRSARYHRYRSYDDRYYDEPYGYYRPRYRGPGIGLQFNIN